MGKIKLSKSRYCKCVQCEKILWLEKYKPECAVVKKNESIVGNGRKVGELAKGLFGDYHDIPYNEDLTVMIEKTSKLMQDKANIITEASFSYDNNFCSVDILKNDSDGVEIYEVKSATEIKPYYLDDVAYQYFVLSNLGITVKKASIIYLNNDTYIRGKELDINQLFNVEDVTFEALEKQVEVKNNIDMINNIMKTQDGDNEPLTDIWVNCLDKDNPCVFWDYCTRDLPKPNVFDIVLMKKTRKFEKYYEGVISFEDLENDDDITTPRFVEQIDFELHDREPKIEKNAIDEILDSLKYPLYFIDYETCQYAVPEFEGTKAYQQIPFQYSLHIIQEEGAPLKHKEFLAEVGDENIIRHFAESMINDMPKNGSVIIYNNSFEPARNREIAEMYPDLKDEMERINANIVDFMVPFKSRKYYTKEMEGSYSIKKVLPALFPDDDELDYTKLPGVHKGDEAANAFLTLNEKTPEEQKEIREGLLRYCELDTYAMVKIWEKFKEVTGD
ncbi:DUF2779 domain-containing protein [Methanobrevibacter sp.]